VAPESQDEADAPDRATWRRGGEAGIFVGALAVLVGALHAPLLAGTATFTHDVLYWCYPIYHFLADSLHQGRFPYWNPFSHAGEPFYPILLQLRFLEPVTILGSLLGGLLTQDLLVLFNWDRVLRGIVASLGTYLLLRQWATHWLTRVSLVPVVLWSSLFLGAFRQNAAVDAFISGPYVAYFLFRILDGKGGWGTWVGLAVSIGVGAQSYFFAPVAAFLLLVVAGLLLFERSAVREVMRQPGAWRRLAVAFALMVAMGAPNIVVLLERGAYVFPARTVDFLYRGHPPIGQPLPYEPGPAAEPESQIFMPYALVKFTGTSGNLWNLVQMVTPDANAPVRGLEPETFGAPSEAVIYLGLLVYAGALLGLLAGHHRYKRVWLVIAGGLALLYLGPAGGLHMVLYHVYPPLWFMRHTHIFVNFLVMALLYFYVLGANRVVAWNTQPLFPREAAGVTVRRRLGRLGLAVAFVLLLAGLAITVVTDPRAIHSPSLWPYAGIALGVGATLAVLFRRRIGAPLLFWGLLAAHAATALALCPLPTVVAARFATFFLLPIALVALVRSFRPALYRPMLVALVVMLSLDLLEYLHGSATLWGVPRAEVTAGRQAGPIPPQFPSARQVSVGDSGQPHQQAIRYLELLTRTPAAFSTLIRAERGPETPTVADARRLQRWNTLLMPRAYFELVHSEVPAHVLEHVFAIDRPLIAFRSTTEPTGSGGQPLRYNVLRYDHDTLDLEVRTAVPGVLEYADGYDRHWKATVDGRPAEILRVDTAFKGVAVGSGTHIVRWTYDPVPFRIALHLFFGAPALAIALTGAAAVHRWATSRVSETREAAASLPVRLS
jgi:hypothetical protein